MEAVVVLDEQRAEQCVHEPRLGTVGTRSVCCRHISPQREVRGALLNFKSPMWAVDIVSGVSQVHEVVRCYTEYKQVAWNSVLSSRVQVTQEVVIAGSRRD